MSSRRRGVVYNMDEEGKARLVFENAAEFEGTLETKSGEVLSIRGLKNTHNDDNLFNINVVDAESGCTFLLEGVVVRYDEKSVEIIHPSIAFSSDERLVGMKAMREIQEHLTPRPMAQSEEKLVMFIGFMKVSLMTSYQNKPMLRRESICDDSTRIIEESDDFLA